MIMIIGGIMTLSYWGFVALLPWWWLMVCVLLAFFVFLTFLMKAACLTHIVLLDFIILVIYGDNTIYETSC
jgi:hypothetical protein